MVRGRSKRVIYLKNPESQIFEGAFFLLRDTSGHPLPKESDIVEEATRILYEGEGGKDAAPLQKKKGDGAWRFLFFLFGALFAFGVSAILFLTVGR